jgi:hypothetical protein
VVARDNPERGVAGWRDILGLDSLDSGCGRSAAFQIRHETGDGIGLSFYLDEDAVGVIAHETGEVGGRREAVDERAESNSLDDSGDTQTSADG